MESKRLSNYKASFLEVPFDIRFLIYDALLEELEAHYTELRHSETPPLNIDFSSLPDNAIKILRETCKKTRLEIDEWFAPSKSALTWGPKYGSFDPALTSWKFEIVQGYRYSYEYREREQKAREVLAYKRMIFKSFCKTPYRDVVRNLEWTIDSFMFAADPKMVWKRMPKITRGLWKLRNLETLTILWTDMTLTGRVWYRAFFDEIEEQLNLGDAIFIRIGDIADNGPHSGRRCFARVGAYHVHD